MGRRPLSRIENHRARARTILFSRRSFDLAKAPQDHRGFFAKVKDFCLGRGPIQAFDIAFLFAARLRTTAASLARSTSAQRAGASGPSALTSATTSLVISWLVTTISTGRTSARFRKPASRHG